MIITSIYAALLAFLFVYLSFRTINLRRRFRIGLGDANNPLMLRAVRVHANFAEYVPFALLLIFFVESSGAAHPLFVHVLGVIFVVARLSHAFGVSQEPENLRLRQFGMVLTFTVILVSAIFLLFLAFTR